LTPEANHNNDFTGNRIDKIDVIPFNIDFGINSLNGIQIWPNINVSYELEKTLIVRGTLRIDPGTTITFPRGKGIQVTGVFSELIANGTPDEPIIFTSSLPPDTQFETQDHWGGINYLESSSQNNLLNYVTIEFGGNMPSSNIIESANIVATQGSNIRLINSEISHSANYGIVKSQSNVEEINVTFSDNVNGNRLTDDF